MSTDTAPVCWSGLSKRVFFDAIKRTRKRVQLKKTRFSLTFHRYETITISSQFMPRPTNLIFGVISGVPLAACFQINPISETGPAGAQDVARPSSIG